MQSERENPMLAEELAPPLQVCPVFMLSPWAEAIKTLTASLARAVPSSSLGQK